MLRNLERFVPGFLKDLDRRLLLERPALWATKLHYMLFVGGLGLALTVGFGMMTSVDLQRVSGPEYAFIPLLILVSIAFLAYAWRASVFHVDRFFGERNSGNRFRDQLIHAGILLSLVAIPLVGSMIQNEKNRTAVSKEELVQDLNTLNKGYVYFQDNAHYRTDGYDYYDFDHYSHYSFSSPLLNNNPELKKEFERSRSSEAVKEKMAAYLTTLRKYSHSYFQLTVDKAYQEYQKGDDYNHYTFRDLHTAEYEADRNLDRLQEAQSGRTFLSERGFYFFFAFFAFGFWILFQNLLQSSWRNIFLAIAVAAGLGILGGITMGIGYEVFRYNDEFVAASLFLGAYAFMFIQSFRKSNSKRMQSWKTITLTITAVATQIVPLILALWVEEMGSGYSHIDDDTGFALLSVGMIVSFVMWNLFFLPQYVRLVSRPKSN